MKYLKTVVCLLTFTLAASVVIAQPQKFVEGQHYTKLQTPIQTPIKNEKVHVYDLFWYGCPHCSNLEPVLRAWSKDKPEYITFEHIPAVFSKRWEFHAKAYYTIKALGVSDTAHQAIFEHIHDNKDKLNNIKQFSSFLSKRYDFDKEQIENMFNSFGVKTNLNKAKSFTRKAGVTFVPAIVVGGEYVTSLSQAGSEKKLIQTIEFLAQLTKEKG